VFGNDGDYSKCIASDKPTNEMVRVRRERRLVQEGRIGDSASVQAVT
jgi:hypothetical protein